MAFNGLTIAVNFGNNRPQRNSRVSWAWASKRSALTFGITLEPQLAKMQLEKSSGHTEGYRPRSPPSGFAFSISMEAGFRTQNRLQVLQVILST